jgi:hypothetical protein
VYYDADLMSADYDTYGELDSLDADASLLSCLSQLSRSELTTDLNKPEVNWSGSRHRLGVNAAEPAVTRPRRKRRPIPLLPVSDSRIIQVHGQTNDDDEEEEDDTDEIIGIAASLQQEIKQLIERRKAQAAQQFDDDD